MAAHRTGVAAIGFALVIAFYVLREHYEHALGALPYLLLLACPLMHLFMHHGHGGPAERRVTAARPERLTVVRRYLAAVASVNLARGEWAYTELMPTLPWLGTGLAPLAQWLLVPAALLAWACRERPGAAARRGGEGRAPV